MALQEIMDVRLALGLTTSPAQLGAILHSVKAGTARIMYDHNDMARGYLLWANVNKESALLLARKGRLPAYGYEWQEGSLTLILAVVVIPGALPAKYGQLRRFLRQQRAVLYRTGQRVTLCVRRGRRVVKKRYALPSRAAGAAA